MLAALLQGLAAAMPVPAAWPVARAFRIAAADLNRADRCSPTVGMTCGWRRPDSRIAAVGQRRMMLELPAMLAIPAVLGGMPGAAMLGMLGMLGAGMMLAQSDRR